MPVYFKSIASSSNGNCLALWTENTCVIVDFGLSSMKRCRQAIADHLPPSVNIDAVVISHTHSDHISYYPLRVLEGLDCSVRVHQDCLEQLRAKHFNGNGFGDLDIRPFADDGFQVGDFVFEPFEVSHHPHYPTFGFVVKFTQQAATTKIVIATDLNDWQPVMHYFVDADFIFIESNYDHELMRQYYNHNSTYHLPNPETAGLLCAARQKSVTGPQAVMLGHISPQRNTKEIAIAEVRHAFTGNGIAMDFDLFAAPQRHASDTIEIMPTPRSCPV